VKATPDVTDGTTVHHTDTGDTPITTTSPAPRPATARATLQNLASFVVVLVAVAVHVGYAVRTGLPLGDALRALGAVGLTQVLPGALLWRCVRPRHGWLLEDLAMGFALGIAIAVPAQVLAGLTRQPWVAAALPVLFSATLLVVGPTRRRIRSVAWSPIAWWLTPLSVVLSFWAVRSLVAYFRVNQVTWQTLGQPHIDAYLHQALASQLLHRGPTSWPTVAGEDLGYHWFAHAWIAHVANTSGAGLDVVLLRFVPALMPVTVVLCVMVAGLRLAGSARVALLATALTMVGSGANPIAAPGGNLPLNPDSPTLALGVPTLMALVVLLRMRWQGALSRIGYLLVPWLSVIAAGTKGATSPLVVAGLGLAAAAMLVWNRRLLPQVLVDLVIVGAGLLFAVVVVFHGSSAGLRFGVHGAAEQTYPFAILGSLPTDRLVYAAVVLIVLAGLSRGALAFAPLFGRRSRRDPLPWLLAGASVAGAGAVGVFSHPGGSQYYFLLTAIPLAALGSAIGAQALARALGPGLTARLVPAGILAGWLIHFAPTRVLGPVSEGTFVLFGRVTFVAALLTCATGLAGWCLGEPTRRARAALGMVAIAGLAMGVIAALNSVRAPLFTEPRRPAALTEQLAVSQAQLDAARYIRDHSGVDDLVMTNRHCTVIREPRGGCDSRRWVVTAFSERQSLVEGWTATPEATRRAPHGGESKVVDYWRPDILELNDGFIAAPTEAARQRLWDLGVRWVYVDKLQAHADTLAPYAERGFDSVDASAWRLLPPG